MKFLILLTILCLFSVRVNAQTKPFPDVSALIYTFYETLNPDYSTKAFQHCLALLSVQEAMLKEDFSQIIGLPLTPEDVEEANELTRPNSPDMILKRKLIRELGSGKSPPMPPDKYRGERYLKESSEIFEEYLVWILSPPDLIDVMSKTGALADDMKKCYAFTQEL